MSTKYFPGTNLRRVAVVTVAATATLLGAAAGAQAHVKVASYTPAVQGSYAVLVFRVPTEENANTTQLQVTIPASTPLQSVSTKPMAGWTSTLTKSKLATPLQTSHGTVNEAVSTITWTAAPGGGIPPNQFDEFELSVGPLPRVSTMAFPAVQTYSNGDVVRWIEPTPPGGQEPDHPVPTLQLTAPGAATTPAAAGASDTAQVVTAAKPPTDDTARVLGVIGIVVGGLGLLAAGGAFALRRRSTSA